MLFKEMLLEIKALVRFLTAGLLAAAGQVELSTEHLSALILRPGSTADRAFSLHPLSANKEAVDFTTGFASG